MLRRDEEKTEDKDVKVLTATHDGGLDRTVRNQFEFVPRNGGHEFGCWVRD